MYQQKPGSCIDSKALDLRRGVTHDETLAELIGTLHDILIRRRTMPEKETIRRARRDKREGKAPSTQAGEFVREEIHHIREGKHGARSTQQAIAIDQRSTQRWR